jgi:hypothetical protein
VNDIHLNVTHLSSGTSSKGNIFKDGWSSDDDSNANSKWDKTSDGYDNRNNVEGVRIPIPETGRYKITIVGYNIPSGPQPFAIAVLGGINPKTLLPPSNLKVEPVPEGNALNLSWEPVLGSTISGYEIYRSLLPVANFQRIFDTNNSNKKRYLDSGLEDGTTYYYRMRTKNIFENVSNFSEVVSGVPQDLLPPMVTIIEPVSYSDLNGNVTIRYITEPDCVKIDFKYYIDQNQNGLDDDGLLYAEIGTDTVLNGTFWWNTSLYGGLNAPAVILAAKAYDEVPNFNWNYVPYLLVDNKPPEAPKLDVYTPNPTKNNNIVLSGRAENNSIVNIYSNEELVGSNYTNSSGGYNIAVELFNGLNNVTARAIDYLGNGPGPASVVRKILVDLIAPIAVSGGNYNIVEDSEMVFNGSKSYDPNYTPGFEEITLYRWTFKLKNNTVVYLEGEVAKYFFDVMGNYTITLTVSDSAGNLGQQEFWVFVKDNTTPIANAGKDFKWNENLQLFLDAGGSIDNDPKFFQNANFTWSFSDYNSTRLKDGKIIEVELYGKNVSYKFDTPGVYNITLLVTDSGGNWNIDYVRVTILDIEVPIASADADMLIVTLGRTVTFDASGSTDNDPAFPNTGNFTWEFKYIDKDITLYGVSPKFRFNKINIFTVSLIVRDSANNSAMDQLNIRVDGDLHPPTVKWTMPEDSSTNVRVTSVIKIKISEPMDVSKVPINSTTFNFLDGHYKLLSGNLYYDPIESLISFVPNEILNFGESYTIIIHSALVDLAGNTLDGNGNGRIDSEKEDMVKIVFTTTNITTTPVNQQKDVKVNTVITVKFSENVSNFAIENTEFNITNRITGKWYQGIIIHDLVNRTLIFKPGSELERNSEYIVNITISFYLVPAEVLPTGDHREIPAIPDDNTTGSSGVFTTKLYSWTFTTEEKGESGDAVEDIFAQSLISLLIIIVIIVVIILAIFGFLYYRYKASDKGRQYGSRKDIDAEYEDEYRKVYGDYPTHERETSKRRRRSEKLRRGEAISRQGSRDGRRRKGRGKQRPMAKARRRERDYEDDYEYEDEYSDVDYEEDDFDFFESEGDYITELGEEEVEDYDEEYDEDDYEYEDEYEDGAEDEFDGEIEFEEDELDELAEDEPEEIDEIDDFELEEIEELEEIDDDEEYELKE